MGNYSEFLLDRDCVVCLEIHVYATVCLRERFGANPKIHIYQGDIADPALRALSEHRCDTAICFNVQEHVKDDIAALKNMAHILALDGRVLLIVPTLPAIMGTVDQSLGHYRRYTRTSLRSAFVAAGYAIEHLRHMNFPGIFGWLLNNCIFKRTEESPSQILFYDKAIVPWVSAIERVLCPFVGLSLVCIARHFMP